MGREYLVPGPTSYIITAMLFWVFVRRTVAPLSALVALVSAYLLLQSSWFWAVSSTLADRLGGVLHDVLIEWFILGR